MYKYVSQNGLLYEQFADIKYINLAKTSKNPVLFIHLLPSHSSNLFTLFMWRKRKIKHELNHFLDYA